MQKEGEKHHPIAAQGLGDAFGSGKDDLLPPTRNPSL
jgi:hypothetical protein